MTKGNITKKIKLKIKLEDRIEDKAEDKKDINEQEEIDLTQFLRENE